MISRGQGRGVRAVFSVEVRGVEERQGVSPFKVGEALSQ